MNNFLLWEWNHLFMLTMNQECIELFCYRDLLHPILSYQCHPMGVGLSMKSPYSCSYFKYLLIRNKKLFLTCSWHKVPLFCHHDRRQRFIDENILKIEILFFNFSYNRYNIPVTWGNFGQWGNFGHILALSIPDFLVSVSLRF